MTSIEAFWDSSALTPLCVQQPTSSSAHSLLPQFTPVVWWATAVEIRSAIARLHRFGGLDLAARQLALVRLQELRQNWDEIIPADDLRDKAATLLDTYPLRAADSLQLAAALIWCRSRPAGRRFLCADTRLCDAAEQAGFTVIRP